MKIEKYYDRLKPDERFRLLVAAMARGDDEDYDHLTNTAPRKNYSMRDARVGDKLEAAENIALRFSISIMHTLHLIEQHLSTIRNLENDADEDVKGYLDKMGTDLFARHAELKAICEGLTSFCESIQVEPEMLLKAYSEPGIQFFDRAKEICTANTSIPVSEKCVIAIKSFLKESWKP